MPKASKGEKRPADVIGNAVKVMGTATGEEEEDISPESAAAALGKRGCAARVEKLTSEQRKEMARRAARKRWAEEDT